MTFYTSLINYKKLGLFIKGFFLFLFFFTFNIFNHL